MGNACLEEFRTSVNSFAQALTTQSNREVVAKLVKEMCAYIIREFLRMKPLELSGSKVEQDPYEFIDKVYKTLAIMGLTSS